MLLELLALELFAVAAGDGGAQELDRGTPGISTGAWKLRNSPARERLSGERSVMSRPSNSTEPPSTR